jgi:Fungal specific transcription factor domain
MHHYTTSTCKSLPDGNSRKANYVWSVNIPKLAFQSDLVLSALLGISALHHWALTPNEQRLSYAAGYYFDRAVRNHRKALSEVDQTSAEAVLATAILITHHTWLAAHSGNEPYQLHLQTYYMARGIQVLFEQMYPWIAGSGYLWYIERTPAEDTEEAPYIDPFLVNSQEDLEKLSITFYEKEVTATDRVVYEKTVAELASMCLSICKGGPQVPLQRGVATMPLRLPERFLELVELKEPRALALLARNLALLQVIDSVWWLHGTGQSQRVAEISVSGIAKMLPLDWAWVMEWPFKVIAGDLRPFKPGTC